MCILLGCDYCDSIKGIGPKKAVDLINKHKCIEKILENIDQKVSCSPVYLLYQIMDSCVYGIRCLTNQMNCGDAVVGFLDNLRLLDNKVYNL